MQDIQQDQTTADLDGVAGTVIRLVRSVPGPLSRVRVQIGEVTVEVECSERPSGAVPSPLLQAEEVVEAAGVTDGRHHLNAPMVGTFYRSPAPGEPPFVREGDLVEAGQQIGILEAMKLMNKIEADRSGRVVEVLVDDATPVEYDQPLLTIVPAGDEA